MTSSNVTDRWKVCKILNAISRKLIKPQENEYKQFRNIRKAKRNKRQMEVQEQKSSRNKTETTTRQQNWASREMDVWTPDRGSEAQCPRRRKKKDGMRKAYRIHGAVSKEQRHSFHLRWGRTTPSYRNPRQRNSSGYIAKKA